MARERFAEEFRQEALRQVVERGYSVNDISKRFELGLVLRTGKLMLFYQLERKFNEGAVVD